MGMVMLCFKSWLGPSAYIHIVDILVVNGGANQSVKFY
jgi:hypothetical protein